MENRQDIADWLDEHQHRFTQLSDEIWANPEVAFREFKSSKLQADFLAAEGFAITWDLGGISTAFVAEWGDGKPVIGFAGEYDALPGLSQKESTVQDPIVAGDPGHGCGHNLLGTGCLAAAVGFKEWLERTGRSATVRYYGCPAEEGGSGKVFMGREGAFDDLDAAFNWHPGYANYASKGSMLGVNHIDYRFHGRTAHAAFDPHSGRSALDAVELMNIGVNYLREHVTTDVRLHYIISHGGRAANVVPDFAESRYYIRAHQPDTLVDVTNRVNKIAQGAAMMTETELEIVFVSGTASLLSNETLADVQYEAMQQLGPIQFTEAEMAYAAEINAKFPESNTQFLINHMGMDPETARQPLIGGIFPSLDKGAVFPASSDVGDLSRLTPLSMLNTATWATRAAAHSWGAVATGCTTIGHKGMMYAAKVMALGAAELVLAPAKLAAARAEFDAQIAQTPYVCGTPDDVYPPSYEHPLR
ncbi:MAG: amidohydrolase [Anaerolineales bacterium]|nr:amidohydrolase [Anaerolineales bacterium]